jgi:hypothetical protein
MHDLPLKLFQIECTRTTHQGQWQGIEIERHEKILYD